MTIPLKKIVRNLVNGLKLKIYHEKKTEFIYFGYCSQLQKCVIDSVDVMANIFSRIDCIRYLCGFMDSNRSFKVHTKTKCATAMRNFMKIKRIRRFLTKDACETLEFGLIISNLDYSNSMLVNSLDCTLAPFRRLQNMCAKLVLNSYKYDSSLSQLKDLHWLSVRVRIHF